MINKKFKRAAVKRKFAAFFLTILTVFGLLSLLFIQAESESLYGIVEMVSEIFSDSVDETTSTNYP